MDVWHFVAFMAGINVGMVFLEAMLWFCGSYHDRRKPYARSIIDIIRFK